jgi:hypothetical protein
MVSNGNSDTVFKNAIVDFYHTSSLARKNSTFSIYKREYDSGVIGVSILSNDNKIYVLYNSPQSKIPDRYIEYNNKLFYWYDNEKDKDPNIVKKLSEYKIIDSLQILTEEMSYKRDDAKKATQYYFCKNNLLEYKKEETSIAMPKEIKVQLNCTQQ